MQESSSRRNHAAGALSALPLAGCIGLILATAPVEADSAGDLDLPVLWETPACKHEKLGTVSADAGVRVTETTGDHRLPPVRAISVLQRLSDAASAKGGNAVVLRAHQGIYFTHNGKRSKGPVFVQLRGAVVLIPGAIEACSPVFVSADELDRRMRGRKPQNVSSERAYADPAERPSPVHRAQGEASGGH